MGSGANIGAGIGGTVVGADEARGTVVDTSAGSRCAGGVDEAEIGVDVGACLGRGGTVGVGGGTRQVQISSRRARSRILVARLISVSKSSRQDGEVDWEESSQWGCRWNFQGIYRP
jgi:hypothetical protein